MFDRILANLSLRRSAAGIYFELRTLRQMLEIVFEREQLELPRDRKRPVAEQIDEGVDDVELTEEQIAEQRARAIRVARLEGRDPGTDWEEDPNR